MRTEQRGAVRSNAVTAAPTDAASEATRASGPTVTFASVLLRDTPTSTGRPIPTSDLRPRRSARFWSGVLPKPIPGSTQILSSGTPSATANARRSSRNEATSATTSSYRGASCIVRGLPCMCMRHRYASAAATTPARSGSPRSAVTSLTITAPAASERRATSAFVVSTETSRPVSCSTTGSTRRSSSSRDTGGAPGRVDSPPTSTRPAPASSIARAPATAASVSMCTPPSEKLSGVTFTMPMTVGRGQRFSSDGRPMRHGR